ncbi:MAG: hypothetical protein HQ515_09445 [Phycisphaeraceae bacterium]|nr:hypothetical protein [Phycisphaeraceae bacterium]
MKSSIQPYYNIALASGAVFKLPAYGRILNIMGVTGANYVSVALPGQTFVRLKEKISFQLPELDAFQGLEFRNDEGVSITFDIIISDVQIFDNDSAGMSNLLDELQGVNAAETVITQVTVTAVAAELVAVGTAKRNLYLQQKYPGNGAYVFYGDATLDATHWIAQTSPIGSTVIKNWTGVLWAMTSVGSEYVGGRIE